MEALASPTGPAQPVRHHLAGLKLVVGTFSVLMLSVVIPLALVLTVPQSPRSGAWALTMIALVWSGARLTWAWLSREARLFDFFFWLFTYIFMGIAPTVQIYSGLVSTTTPGVDPALDQPTAVAVLTGLLCYEVGRLAVILGPRLAGPGHRLAPIRVSVLRTYLLLVLGTAGAVYFLSRIGVTLAFSSRTQAQSARAAAWPDPSAAAVAYALAIYPLLVAVGGLSEIRKQRAPGESRTGPTLAMIGGMLVIILIVNPIASARYTFGTVAFALVVFLGSMRTRVRSRATRLATILGFLFIFPLADAFRRDVVNVSRSGFFDEYMSNPDYDAFWQIANAIDYWGSGIAQPMNQLLGSLFFWVPRSMWPDKPTDTGVMLAGFRGYAVDNLSAPLWAEFMVNGGWLAIVIGFLILGIWLRAFDSRLVGAFDAGGWWAIVGAVFPVYLTILLRGSLLQATGAMAVAIACVWFVRLPRTPRGTPTSRLPPHWVVQATEDDSRAQRE